jgi:hypothetical protein
METLLLKPTKHLLFCCVVTQRLTRAEAIIDIQRGRGVAEDRAGAERRRAYTESVAALAPATDDEREAAGGVIYPRAFGFTARRTRPFVAMRK